MLRRRPHGRRIAERPTPPSRLAAASVWLAVCAVTLVWLGCLLLAVGPLAAAHGTHLWDSPLARIGAAGATWLAVVLLAWRIGGPVPLVASFAGACAVLLLLEPRGWVLSAGAVVAATSYGLLGMVMTRPIAGLRAIREAVVAAAIGAAGAVAVTGYDVSLRPYRFRMMVLALTLLSALALARRLGLGFESLGRRGLVLMVVAVIVLAGAFGYVQAVRHWGSSEVVTSIGHAHGRIRDWLGASPRSIEALVGFPATIWGVAVRKRRRQGWWMSAFGSLAAAGVATSLASPSVKFAEAAGSTGYNLLIGSVLGLVVISMDRLLTGTGRRSRIPGGADVDRPEPSRLGHLL
jgi:hypothetical protein